MKGHAVERIAQGHGAGERRDEGHARLGRQRQRGHAGGRSDVAEQREHVVPDELLRVGGTAVGLVAIIELADLDLATTHTALGIELIKVELGASMELYAQLGSGPAERRRLAQHDAVVLCASRVESGHQGGTGANGKMAAVEQACSHGEDRGPAGPGQGVQNAENMRSGAKKHSIL